MEWMTVHQEENSPAVGMDTRARLQVEGAGSLAEGELLELLWGRPPGGHARTPPLWRLGGRRLEELRGYGLEEEEAVRLACALELGSRALRAPVPALVRLTHPSDVAAVVSPRMAGLPREMVVALVLDSRKRLLAHVPVAEGWTEGVAVDPREVFRAAVVERGAGVILVHNHPSGDPTPSLEDRTLTRRLCRAGDVLGIRLLDHVVVARGGYVSLAAEGVCT
jgi:DNA repair protein RadC